MYQHIESQLFLAPDALGNFCAHGVLVCRLTEAPAAKLTARFTNGLGLRERTNGGGGVERQRQMLCLALAARLIVTLALAQRRGDRAQGVLDVIAVHAR